MPETEPTAINPDLKPPSIRKLNDKVINKIAAGEVVERPASALKELVENSIDAGARNIQIEAHFGGIQNLLVRDDGCGIKHDEMELALSRHATSKLGQFDDIEGIRTLGFRGEALPSIASVSRVSVSTRTNDDVHGWQVVCEGGGNIDGPQPVQHGIGTSVEVSDLFFNVPVRRKFLRTANTEYSYLDKMVRQMVLARTDIDFIFTHNDKRSTRYHAAIDEKTRWMRLASVFGDDFADSCIQVNLAWEDLRVSGWVSMPDQTRAQPDRKYLFVNGRCIQDRRMMYAIRQAYSDVLYDSSRYPLCVLYLDVDPKLVDINVHPTKSQVRFQRQQDVYRAILRAVGGALRGERPGTKQSVPLSLELSSEMPSSPSAVQGSFSLNPDSNWTQLNQGQERSVPLQNTQAENTNDSEIPPLGFALAQLGGAYILAENSEGLIIVDMHASHERITYEQLKKDFENTEMNSQILMVPVIVKATAEEVEVAMNNVETLADLGFEVSQSDDNALCVRSVPSLLGAADVEQLFRDILSDLIAHEDSSRVEHVQNEILASMSCHSAIRANHVLSIPQMNGLLRQMEATENSGYCSHGRPTWRQFSIAELDKLFHRGR